MNKILSTKSRNIFFVALIIAILALAFLYWSDKNYIERKKNANDAPQEAIMQQLVQNSQIVQSGSKTAGQNAANQNQPLERYNYKSDFIEAGYESGMWNLYASIGGKKKLIFSHDRGFEGLGGELATTTQPYIALATFREGDSGGWSDELIFINLINGNYINIRESNGFDQITVQRNSKDYKSFSVYIKDNCGTGTSRTSGNILAAATGIGQYNILAHDNDKFFVPKPYNEELYYAFSGSKYLTCENERELGYTGFKEPYSLHLIGYNDDFTKLYFKANGTEAGGKEWNEYFEYGLLNNTFSISAPMQKSFKLTFEN